MLFLGLVSSRNRWHPPCIGALNGTMQGREASPNCCIYKRHPTEMFTDVQLRWG